MIVETMMRLNPVAERTSVTVHRRISGLSVVIAGRRMKHRGPFQWALTVDNVS